MAKKIVETLVTELTADGAKLKAEMEKSFKDAKSWGDRMSKVAKNVAIFGGAGAVGISAGVVALTKNAIDNADAMSKQAQAVGMATEKLSAYVYAAEMGGVGQEQFVSSLGKFNRVIAEAYQGVGKGVDAFDALGISITDNNGKLKNNSDLFAEVADRFKSMPDGIEKSALAMDLFGRSGTALIPTLNGGKESLIEMTAEAERLGLVISEDTGKKAELFNDNLEKMQKAFEGLGNRIAEASLDELNDFTNIINDPATQEGLAIFTSGLITLGGELVKFLSEAAKVGDWVIDEIDAAILGPKADDIVRLEDHLAGLKEQQRRERMAASGSVAPMGFGGLSVPAAAENAELKKEIEHYQFLVDEYYKTQEELFRAQQAKAAGQRVMTQDRAPAEDKVPGLKSANQKAEEKKAAKVSPVYDPFLDGPGAMDYDKFQAQQEAADQEVAIQREKFRRIHEEKLAAQGLDEELETYQYKQAEKQLNDELNALREKNLLTDELEKEFQTAKEEQEAAHLERLKQIKDKAAQEDFQRQMIQLQATESFFGDLYEISSVFGGRQSRLTRALFAFQKVASIAQAWLSIKTGIAKAQDKGWPAGLIEGAAIAGYGASIVSDMRSLNIAHGGIDSVPKESTYLLDQGERVVSPRQNKDLTEFLKEPGSKKSVNVTVINNNNGASVDVRETATGVEVIVNKVIDKIKDGLARGNGIDSTLRAVYPQLIRRGS